MHNNGMVSGMVGLVILLVLVGLSLGGAPALAQNDATPTPFWQTNDDPDFNAQLDQVEQATSILRGLEPDAPVTRAFINDAQLLAYLLADLDTTYPAQAARDDAIFYHAFGFMDLAIDLRALQLDVLTEQIGGFYDTDLEAMFVISERDELNALNQILYAHEYTHALQDQWFDLEALGVTEEALAAQPDTTLALLSLVEGDAMLITEGYQTWLMEHNPLAVLSLLGEALFIETEALFGAPDIIQAELMFPYAAGRDFVYTLFAVGEGWDLVNEAYANPPTTTEHILHPERYVGGEGAQEVTITPVLDQLGEGYRLVWDRALGEFYLREHLRLLVPAEVADAAAAGWGGDRYHVYFDDATETTVLVWRTVWDTAADADEFAATYRGYNAARFGDPAAAQGDAICWQAELEAGCLFAGTVETLVVSGPEIDLLLDVVAAQAPLR